jgi:CubicO group peptidase (beta-lactamase class C family)
MYNWPLLTEQLSMLLDKICSKNEECGCQLTIFHHGEKVVDIASGMTAGSDGRPVAPDDLFPLFSCGKAVLATAVLQGIERGLFALDTPLAEFWPEFAVKEKCGITVEHVLSHRAGMYILPKVESDDDFADWEKMCSLTAALTPRNAPGKKCVYHPLTFAWLAGNLLVLAEKQPLQKIIYDRILRPCGIENELFFGLDAETDRRFVPIDDTAMPEKPSWYAVKMHNKVLRYSCIPSFNGCGSARALAKFYAALNGTLPGVELLAPETLELASKREWRDEEDVTAVNAWHHFGLGFVLAGPVYKRTRIYGHGGAAGAEGFFDRDTELAIGFTKNRPLPTHPHHPVRNKISEILNIPVRLW